MTKKRILLIDFMNVYMTMYHQHCEGKLWKFLGELRTMVEQFKIDRVVFACEGGSKYRESLLPTYKGARKEKRANETPEEKARFKRFLDEDCQDLIDTAKLLDFQVLQWKGAEADDIFGFYANQLDLEKYELLILSSDSDLHQLLRPGIVQAAYGRDIVPFLSSGSKIPAKVWVNSKTFTEQYGVTPQQFTVVKALSGDTSDSIPSPRGLGGDTATKLLLKYSTLAAIEQAALACEHIVFAQQFGGVEAVTAKLADAALRSDPEHTELFARYPTVKAFEKAVKEEAATFHVPRMALGVKEAFARGEMEIVRRNIRIVDLNHGPDALTAIFGNEGLAYLQSSLQRLEAPPTPDKAAFRELLLECGKITIAERLDFWLHPFTKE